MRRLCVLALSVACFGIGACRSSSSDQVVKSKAKGAPPVFSGTQVCENARPTGSRIRRKMCRKDWQESGIVKVEIQSEQVELAEDTEDNNE